VCVVCVGECEWEGESVTVCLCEGGG
jgi:hypothetical protein